MRIAVYPGLGDGHEIRIVPDGLSYRAAFPDIDFEHAAIVEGGRFVPPDSPARDGSVVRVLPEAPAAVAAGVMIASAIVAGVAIGVAMYQMKKAQSAQSPVVQAEKQRNVTNNDSGSNLPFQRGATNSLATGKSQPYVMGRHGFTPYLLTDKWYELSGPGGRDQYVTQAFECGFGQLVFEELRAGEVMLRQFPDGVPQDGDGPLLDSAFSRGGSWEIAQDGNAFSTLTQVNTRIASATSNQSIPYRSEIDSGAATELILTLDPYARDVTIAISFPMGLYATNRETGEHTGTTARIGAYFSCDGGENWATMPFTFTAATGNSIVHTDTVELVVVRGAIGWGSEPLPGRWAYDTVYTEDVIDLYESKGYCVMHVIPDNSLTGQSYDRYILDKPYNVAEMSGTLTSEFTLNTTDGVRYEATKTFTWAQYQANRAAGKSCFYVKLVNESAKDSYVTNAACLLYYESHCFDPERSEAAGDFVDCPLLEPKEMALSAMLAVRIKSSAANADKLQKINVVVRSLARIWDGEEWSAEKTTTSNPAAILLEILTSHIHPMSRFADTELDLASFGGLYEFCEENSLQFNAVQTTKTTKKALLETVCGVCRATLYWNMAGLLSVAWDHWQGGPLAVLDADSVISVSVKKEYARRVDAMRITYTEAGTWEPQTTLVKRRSDLELDEDSVIQELTVTGPEYLPEVQKYARYLMACMSLRPKAVTIRLGREGMFFTPWSRIRLTDDALGDEPQDLIITAARSDGEGWELECADYDDGIYDSGDISDYESHVREWADPAGELPVPYVRQGELEEQLSKLNGTESSAAADPDRPTITAKASMDGLSLAMQVGGDGLKNSVKSVTWKITRPDGTEAVVEDDASAGYAFSRALDGYPEAAYLARYTVTGTLTNIYGRTAISVPVHVDVSGYGTWIPLVAELTAQRVTGRTATLSFSQRQGRLLYGEIRYKIEIRKHGEVTWYDPNLTSDPYRSVDAYKAEASSNTVTEGLNTTHAFTQTLPLDGQNDVLYYESWYYTSADKKDAYGNPVQQSARTEAFRSSPPHTGTMGTFVLADGDQKPFGLQRHDGAEVYGEIGGTGTAEETVCVVRYQGELYELVPEVVIDGVSYQIMGGMVTIDGEGKEAVVWGSTAVIDGEEHPVNGIVEIGGTEFLAEDVCDAAGIFSARRHSKFFVENGANPRDTLYEYRATAYTVDPATGNLVHSAEGLSVFVTALATSAADVVNSAITHNKIAEGAVQVDNLAAGCITADKMAVRDLFAICGVFGRIQDNEITDVANNFWNLETGQFQISNGVKDADGRMTLPESEYFAYTPRGYVQPDGTVAQEGSFWFKIANFAVSAVSSIIKGVFRVQDTMSQSETRPLLEANPMATADQQTGTPAKTVKVNGTLDSVSVGMGILNAIYPVGSIYMTMADTSPSALFPGTEWEKLEGRFLLGASEDYAKGSTGGEATHILTEQEMPSHAHDCVEGGSHHHSVEGREQNTHFIGTPGSNAFVAGTGPRNTSEGGSHSHTIQSAGGGEAHNNMPPYLAVNMYRRTA
jgi:hypothetical protein